MHLSFSVPNNKSVLITSIFIVVMATHLAILNIVWKPNFTQLDLQENVRYLESFTTHSENTENENTYTDDTLSQKQIATHAPVQPIPEGQPEETQAIKKTQGLNKPLSINIPNSVTSTSRAPTDTINTPPIIHASYLNNPAPPYPRKSRRLGEQGKVILAVEISAQGDAAQATIITSSGHSRLDKAALETVSKWRFVAGKKAGVPQKMWVNIPINFVLE